jgi:hypothetical protein
MLTLLLLADRHDDDCVESNDKIPFHEWIATCALCLLLPIQLLLAKIATGYFLPRYAIGTCLGMALLCAWGVPRLRLIRGVAERALALSLLGFLFAATIDLLAAQSNLPAWHPDPSRETISMALLNAPRGLPIVVANAYEYAPIWWYSPPSIQNRLTYLSDVPYAKLQRDFLPELSLETAQNFIPLHTSAYAPFLQSHPRFLLYMTGQARLEWVEPRLVGEGWRLTPASPPVERKLFLVERSPGAH